MMECTVKGIRDSPFEPLKYSYMYSIKVDSGCGPQVHSLYERNFSAIPPPFQNLWVRPLGSDNRQCLFALTHLQLIVIARMKQYNIKEQ